MCTIVPIVQRGLLDVGIPQNEVHPKEIVHMYLRERFCPSNETWNDVEQRYESKPKSVADMDNAQFFHFKEDIQRWAVEFLGVYIPDPNELCSSWVIMPD